MAIHQFSGKNVRLNDRPFTVIGVLPKGFSYPDPLIQLWTPFHIDNNAQNLQSHFNHMANVVARLKPGVSSERAIQEASALQYQINQSLNAQGPVAEGVSSRPMLDDIVQDVRTPLYVLLGAVGCLLLIACLNISNLLVARAASRRKEIAIRSALGAGRLRLCREQLTESLLICLMGGALGVALALSATRWLTAHWKDMPRADMVHIDGTVCAFAVAIYIRFWHRCRPVARTLRHGQAHARRIAGVVEKCWVATLRAPLCARRC